MRIHFMGAGGSGVSGLMLIAKELGHAVSGCDARHTPYLDMLAKKGIPTRVGHDTGHLDRAEVLVRSSAIPDSDPEVVAARQICRIPVLTRGEFLAELLSPSTVIGIAGAHGKTSTTWLTWQLLRQFGVPASLYTGGKAGGVNAVTAAEPWVVELDESDGSIFRMRPKVLVITNLELEHVDYYGTDAEMLRRFREYMTLVGHRRFVVGRGYPLSDRLFEDFGGLTFPTRAEVAAKKPVSGGRDCKFTCETGRWALEFHGVKSDIGSANDPAYLIQNRAAALLASYTHIRELHRDYEPVDAGFWMTLPAVERRFEKKGTWRDIALIDDYAHHPSEVQAVMDRAVAQYGRYLLVFQPHRHTRFDRFFDEFAKVLKGAPALVILPVFGAGEPAGKKDSRDLYDLLKKDGMNTAYYCETTGEAAVLLSSGALDWTRAVITAGAGDVNDLFGLLEK